jgi:hypothetical protein
MYQKPATHKLAQPAVPTAAPGAARPAERAAERSAESSVTLPISAVLLLALAYANLWIMDRVPELDWFQRTLPRVLLLLLAIGYLAIIWISGVAPSRAARMRAQRWRSVLALALIAVNVLLPTAYFIANRLQTGVSAENVIDWPLQIEAGSRLLLEGRSPYGVDYSFSEMRAWSISANFPDNPAVRHAIHLPVNFILGVLSMSLWQGLTGWYDARLLLIAAYIVVLLVAPRLCSRWEEGHALQIGLALNPLLVESFVLGLSDYLLLAWLVLAIALRQRGYVRVAAALLGVAIATRQFSWLLAPVYLSAEWFSVMAEASGQSVSARLKLLIQRLWPLPLVVAITILPFFLSNPRGFYEDVIAFGSGGIADAYPIGGPNTYGLSAIVLAYGWAADQHAQFPFSTLQLIATLPLIAYAAWSQRRRNTLRRMLLSYVLILAVFLFTGRFMHTNYVGFVFALLLLTCFADDTPLSASAQPARS